MSKFNPLSGAIRFALVAGTAALVAAPVYAQSEETPTSLDQIVVTGSRIQSQTVTSSAPVTEIQREDFALSGATRVDDLVNQYPQLTPAFDSQQNNGAVGYATVSLRNLGAERTLTLVNGRRLPPGPVGELRDISIVPAALINRVDILTGGASAVYGSDAVAGVVNFVLDTEFEGFSVNAGYSAYQHDNRNTYMQGLQDARGFDYEDGNSGFDGASKNIDLAWGGALGDGAGHAMAWLTYRENDALFHAQRDYASCALDGTGTVCGGSGTSAPANFLIFPTSGPTPGTNGNGRASFDSNGRWRNNYGSLYNYAPPNYYQRPDERYTAGTAISFEVNEYFTPYFEAMLVNRKDSIQIAESGAFGVPLQGQSCSNPIFGTLCSDLGITSDTFDIYVLRRNVEGGPRRTDTSDLSYRFVVGTKGALGETWNYDASYVFARTNNDTQGYNDFLTPRIQSALLGCPAGAFDGCEFWNIWRPGATTQSSADALAGVSFNKTNTEMEVFNAFATGDFGFGLPSAGGSTIFGVFGVEHRREAYSTVSDNDSAAGNFAGAGASAPPVDGETKVNEVFMEALVPLFVGDGAFKSLDLDLGYRYSDYDRSGGANTYKLGLIADVGMVRPRVGYNRAIRAPGINDLFAPQRTVLFDDTDPCAGSAQQIANAGRTREQCARSGVSAAQFGNIPANPAEQNNQFVGGNQNLTPEQADTYTVGLVFTPIEDLNLAIDYYDVKIEETITGIGASTILNACLDTGLAAVCDLVRRGPRGDLWLADENHVVNITQNFGNVRSRGIDLNANYTFEALGGRFFTSMVGNFILEEENDPLPGVEDTKFDCVGKINPSCRTHEWRHIANVRYARDSWSLNLRWRYFGELDYVNRVGAPLTTDGLVAAKGGIPGYSFIDLSGSLALADNIDLTLGVNNIADKEPPLVGVTNATNANAPGGYDQLGRYIFSSISLKF